MIYVIFDLIFATFDTKSILIGLLQILYHVGIFVYGVYQCRKFEIENLMLSRGRKSILELFYLAQMGFFLYHYLVKLSFSSHVLVVVLVL
jgi:hypothetical protein